MRIDLRYDMISGPARHPQLVMKDLGITYATAEAVSIADCWIFGDCKNVPELLPKYLEKIHGYTPTPGLGK